MNSIHQKISYLQFFVHDNKMNFSLYSSFFYRCRWEKQKKKKTANNNEVFIILHDITSFKESFIASTSESIRSETYFWRLLVSIEFEQATVCRLECCCVRSLSFSHILGYKVRAHGMHVCVHKCTVYNVQFRSMISMHNNSHLSRQSFGWPFINVSTFKE